MSLYMAILRLIHILGGIFWLGVLWYMALFFLPRVKSFGQERGRIMQTMMAPPYPSYMSIASAFTVLSGILMYWNVSGGFSRAWIATPPRVVLGIAGLLGIYVVVEGFLVMRPAGMRIAELGRQARAAGPPNRAVIAGGRLHGSHTLWPARAIRIVTGGSTARHGAGCADRATDCTA